ncbi:MAG: hypothetical protein K6U02_04255 [Firmicutes bacterium]|nr:hypothetical protein [Bacillota bacterium]
MATAPLEEVENGRRKIALRQQQDRIPPPGQQQAESRTTKPARPSEPIVYGKDLGRRKLTPTSAPLRIEVVSRRLGPFRAAD